MVCLAPDSTVEEINRKILNGTVRVVTAEQMPAIVGEFGAERAAVACYFLVRNTDSARAVHDEFFL